MTEHPELTEHADPTEHQEREVSGPAEPSIDELETVALDAVLRRAPRYRAFVAAGVVVGALVGALVAVVPNTDDPNRGATIWIVAIGAAGLGALLGAGLAARADRKGGR